MTAKRYVMLIDTKRCIGCHTCSMACKVENNLPDGVWWNRTLTLGGEDMDTPKGVYPHLQLGYMTLGCQHCENPPCVNVCQAGATYKDPATGIVVQDPEKCVGCRKCMATCPYTGVRQYIFDEPQFATGFAVGSADAPRHRKQTVGKCTFCSHLLARGEQPFCIDVCPTRTRHFGDLNDPNSEVSQLLRQRSYFQHLVEKGTNPSVYFLT